MKRFNILIESDDTMEIIGDFEIEVDDKADVARMLHPLAAREYAENIQQIILENWDSLEDEDDN